MSVKDGADDPKVSPLESREQARTSRQKARDLRQRARMLTEEARRLLERFDELDRACLEREMKTKAKLSNASVRDLALVQLKKSLQQLETLRLTGNDPSIDKLKRDIRKSIRLSGRRAERRSTNA